MTTNRRAVVPTLVDTGHGMWRIETEAAAWIVDLDARIVRREILGMDDVHTPGRAWILLQLIQCGVGDQLVWSLSETPARVPVTLQHPLGIVLTIEPADLACSRTR